MRNFLRKGARIVSNIIFWLLVVIMIVLVSYVVVIRVLEKQGKISEVPINFYTILSQSMYPTIKAGDIIITYHEEDDTYELGDIITFVPNDASTNGVTITHRIVEVTNSGGEYFYKTKGDGNSTADSNVVPNKNVVGKYVFKIPKAGFIQQFLVTRTGWIVAILLPSLGIIIYDIIKIVKRKTLKNLKKVDKPKTNSKIEINEEAKEDLSKVIESGETPVVVKEEIQEAYEDLGIVVDPEKRDDTVNQEENIENLFDETVPLKEDEDETEIL